MTAQSSYNSVREVSAIADLLLSSDALSDARMRLAEAALPVIAPPGPDSAVLASSVVAGALAELEPVLLRARSALTLVASRMSSDMGMVSEVFTDVDARLAGDLQ